MRAKQFLTLLLSFALVASLLAVAPAQSAVTIEGPDESSFNIGAGIRSSVESIEDGAPNGTDRSKDVNLNNMRLYTSGQILGQTGSIESLNFQYNTELAGDESSRLLDAVMKFNFGDANNIWAGRMLLPSNRANLSGPFFQGDWHFPAMASNYPAVFAGRDNAVAYWGTVMDGSLKYQFTASEGYDTSARGPDNLLYSGRVTYNFLDPEPGYYNASTYFGGKDILALSAGYQTESEVVYSPGSRGDYSSFNVELLYEKPLANGHVPTFEASYMDFDRDGIGKTGTGYYVLGGYQVDSWKPHVRYQSFEPDASGSEESDRMDVGVDYILDGHDARISAIYTDNYGNDSSGENSAVTLGMQFQI